MAPRRFRVGGGSIWLKKRSVLQGLALPLLSGVITR